MTVDQFQRDYFAYSVATMAEAEELAEVLNKHLDKNPLGPVVAVDFSPYGYGLMLEVPARTIRRRVH
jgi:hypothetical protein